LASRNTPAAGSGTSRWQALADECLFDCFALLAANAGENPQKVLAEQGIKVLLTEENIEGTVDVLYGGGKKKKCKK
jgi:nitrogen fixation protein NifB